VSVLDIQPESAVARLVDKLASAVDTQQAVEHEAEAEAEVEVEVLPFVREEEEA
jgi:hypothetical protein